MMRRLRGRIAKALRLPRALRAMASWLEATDWVAWEQAQEARRAAQRVLDEASIKEAYEREMARVTLPPPLELAPDPLGPLACEVCNLAVEVMALATDVPLGLRARNLRLIGWGTHGIRCGLHAGAGTAESTTQVA